MTGRRKGTPCACNTDPCSCGSSRNCIRAVNNVSPDPNGDFNIKAGTGIAISDGPDNEITIINSANPNAFIAGNNIELNPVGDDISINLTDEPVVDGLTVNGDTQTNGNTQLNGDLEVNGDIIQNGAAYETHAEHIYSRDDFIIMRDGAIAALAPGDYAGFKVKLYDGVNDGALVIDSSGTARVGDVGDEQPLLTRDEAADLTDGDLLQWDAAGMKAVGSGVSPSDLIQGTGNIGSDVKPIKIVNGQAVVVAKDVINTDGGELGSNKNIKYNISPYNPANIIYANGVNTYLMTIVSDSDRTTTLATLYLTQGSGQQITLNAMLRNQDGTYRYTNIA